MTTTKENGMDKQDAAAEAIAAYIEDDANGAKMKKPKAAGKKRPSARRGGDDS